MFDNYIFENPQFFWLLLLLPVILAWYVWTRKKQQPELRISSVKGFKMKRSLLPSLRHALFGFRLIALGMIITAMARPRTTDVTTRTSSSQGIDIVLSIDVSGSMLARDLKPNRLEALKSIAGEFIEERVSDRIGLVIYAGESFTKTPVTSDKSIVLRSLEELDFNTGLEDGTAIGSGLATSVNRLKDSKAESRVVILLTDGVNNSGFIDPKIASEMAVAHDIKVYTIAVGTTGMALSPVGMLPNGEYRYGMARVEIDEKLLQEIANATGGKYYRATDNESMRAIYEEIDSLEKSEIEELKFYDYEERYRPFLLIAGVLLAFELVLKNTVFRSFV